MINAAIAFRDSRIESEFENAPLLLKMVAEDFCLLSNEYKITPVLIRVHETTCGSPEHENGLAIDFRDEYTSGFTFSPGQQQRIIDVINDKYTRKDEKPTLQFQSSDGVPMHAHIEISKDVKIYGRV
jgi:hypothetical protein